MQNETSVIIFASNLPPSIKRAVRFKLFYSSYVQQIKQSTSNATLQVISAYSNKDIINALIEHKDRIVIFHFEGRSSHLNSLLAAAAGTTLGELPAYLGKLKKLQLVFLSGCATKESAKLLLDNGIQAVMTSSHKLTVEKTEQFSAKVYKQLVSGQTIQAAYDLASDGLALANGEDKRLYLNLQGTEKGRTWRLPGLKIVGDEKTLPKRKPDVKQSLPPKRKPAKRTNYTRKSPFVGSRPFSKDDADVFFGRDAEVETLLNWVTNPGKPAFILLAGAAGVGKTSLIQAGLIPQLEMLDKKPVVYEFSAATDPSLFGKLREKLREDSGIDEPFEAWKEIECKQNRQIILIVDDIGIPFMRPFPGQYAEFPKLLTGLVPIFSDNTFGPKGKVLLSVRNYKVNDVLQQCQNNGFVFDQFPLPRLDGNNLKNAIYRPFQAGSLEQVQIEDEVIAKISTEIQRDSASPGLAYMQEIVLRLWRHAKNSYIDSPKITLENYQWLHTHANLLDCFLEKQLQDIRTNLSNKFSIQQILQFLDFHYDAYNQPISRSNNERSRRFPTIPAIEMRELLVELTQHRLLIHSPGNEKGRLQIGHSTLAVHANARLIAEKQAAMKPARVRKYYQSGSINDDICDTEPSESHMHGDMNNIANTRNNDPAHVSKCDAHSTNEIPLHESCHQSPNHPPFSNVNYENSTKWKHINIQLIELALMIAVVMAIVLFGVLLLGLTVDGSSYVNPYVINLESNVSIDK